MDRHIINSNGVYPGNPLSIEEKQKRLYHYTTLDSFLKIWTTKTLLFSDASNMNDILESHKSLWAHTMSQEVHQNYRKAVYSYKQISLSMDFDSYLRGCMSRMMWGHYGQKGNGVCIELDISKLKLEDTLSGPIVYNNFPPSFPILPSEAKSEEDIDAFVRENKDIFFFTKTSDWAGENEYRILCNQKEKLDISKAIKCIYVTSATSLTCQCVEALVRDEVPVMFFHHNVSGDTQVPLVTSTIKYRESIKPRPITSKSIGLTGFGILTLTKTKSDGTVEKEMLTGEASLIKEAGTEGSTNPSKQ